MDAAPDLIETPPREEITRRVAGLAMALGTFAVSIAWLRATPFDGDGGVVLAGALGLAAPRVLRATDTARGAVFAFWAGSIALGGAIGALVLVRAGTSLTAAGTFGLSLWVALASLRALGGIPLARLLHRGAPLDSLDAPDRAMLRASLWLLAGLAESIGLLRLGDGLWSRQPRADLAAAARVMALGSLSLLAPLLALAAFARTLRWRARWRAVAHGQELRLVAIRVPPPHPAPRWFAGLGTADAVVVRAVGREGHGYREGDVHAVSGVTPADVAGVARGLTLRALVAGATIVASVALLRVGLRSSGW
jgi:hypothetical protein